MPGTELGNTQRAFELYSTGWAPFGPLIRRFAYSDMPLRYCIALRRMPRGSARTRVVRVMREPPSRCSAGARPLRQGRDRESTVKTAHLAVESADFSRLF